MSSGTEPLYSQASGNSSEISYVLVGAFAREPAHIPSAEAQNESTMQPMYNIHTTSLSTNQTDQQLSHNVANAYQQAHPLNVVSHRCMITCQHPCPLQDLHTGNQAHVVPEQQIAQEVRDRQLCQQFSSLQIENSEDDGSSAQVAMAISMSNHTEEAPAWHDLACVGTWASASTECLVGDLDMDIESLGG
jgi:hypothetical protein